MQNALQPIEKDWRHLVVFVLFLQKLNGQVSPSFLTGQKRTDLNCYFCNTEGGLRDVIQLTDELINVMRFPYFET